MIQISYLILLASTFSLVTSDFCSWSTYFTNTRGCDDSMEICPYVQSENIWQWNESATAVPQITQRFYNPESTFQLVLQDQWTMSKYLSLSPASYTIVFHILNDPSNPFCAEQDPSDILQIWIDEQLSPMICYPTDMKFEDSTWLECTTNVHVVNANQILHLRSLVSNGSCSAAISTISVCNTGAGETWFYPYATYEVSLPLGNYHESCGYCGSDYYVCSNEPAWNGGQMAQMTNPLQTGLEYIKRFQFSLSYVPIGDAANTNITVEIGGNAVSFLAGGEQSACGDCRNFTSEYPFYIDQSYGNEISVKVLSDQPICVSFIEVKYFTFADYDVDGDDDGGNDEGLYTTRIWIGVIVGSAVGGFVGLAVIIGGIVGVVVIIRKRRQVAKNPVVTTSYVNMP